MALLVSLNVSRETKIIKMPTSPSQQVLSREQMSGKSGYNIVVNATEDGYTTSQGGGSISIPATSYATNADAVAALGVGKLYKSTTLINGSPIILLTV